MAGCSLAKTKKIDQPKAQGASVPGTAPSVKWDSRDANQTSTNKTRLVEISLGFDGNSTEQDQAKKDPQHKSPGR